MTIQMLAHGAFSEEVMIVAEYTKGSLFWTAIPLPIIKPEIAGTFSGGETLSRLLHTFVPVRSIVLADSQLIAGDTNYKFEVKPATDAASSTIFKLLNKNREQREGKVGFTLLTPLSASGSREFSIDSDKAVLQVRNIDPSLTALKILTKRSVLAQKPLFLEIEVMKVINKINSAGNINELKKAIVYAWDKVILHNFGDSPMECQISWNTLIIKCSKGDSSPAADYITRLLK